MRGRIAVPNVRYAERGLVSFRTQQVSTRRYCVRTAQRALPFIPGDPRLDTTP